MVVMRAIIVRSAPSMFTVLWRMFEPQAGPVAITSYSIIPNSRFGIPGVGMRCIERTAYGEFIEHECDWQEATVWLETKVRKWENVIATNAD